MYGRYFVLFAILFTGWFLRKINFIDDKMDHSINKLVVYFAYPCLIVHNIGELDLTADVLTDFGKFTHDNPSPPSEDLPVQRHRRPRPPARRG